uniref:Uncharacterized protein n=1 Tax=Macaca fascicularis TaxID=9541 RepID=Q8HXF8_MACFA|nr:hypothetical protein [Macaca fascicularis]
MPIKWRTEKCESSCHKHILTLLLRMMTIRTEKQSNLREIMERWNSKMMNPPLSAIAPYLGYVIFVSLSFLICQVKIIISARPNTLRSKCTLHKLTIFLCYVTFIFFV